MKFFLNMVNLQLMLFTLMLVGIILKKKGLIDDKTKKTLSDLLINFILPCNIIHSFLEKIEMTASFWKNCIYAFIISLIVQIFATYISKLLFIKYPKEKKSVMSYGIICSNSSFVGLPVAEALYGGIGVLYTSIAQIPLRFTMWTAGLALFTNVSKKDAFKKLIVHPCIVSIFIGFLLMILPIELPVFLNNSITSVSKCTIPMSMIVIGSILADADIKSLFSKPILYYTFLRLIAFPLLALGVLSLFNVDKLVVSIIVLMCGLPAGSTTSILAEKYDCDSLFASQIVFVSTLFSMVTIPFLTLLI